MEKNTCIEGKTKHNYNIRKNEEAEKQERKKNIGGQKGECFVKF